MCQAGDRYKKALKEIVMASHPTSYRACIPQIGFEAQRAMQALKPGWTLGKLVGKAHEYWKAHPKAKRLPSRFNILKHKPLIPGQ
jgi:hypothetical protein